MFKELLILSLTATVYLANNVEGACKDPDTPTDFDLEKFAGTWYEVESTMNLETLDRKCVSYKLEYKEKNKGSVLHKFYSIVMGSMKTEYSDVTAAKSSEPAKLTITPLKTDSIFDRKWTLFMVDTDYDKYAIAYSCQQIIFSNIEMSYILSRTKKMDDETKAAVYDKMKEKGLPMKNLRDIPQEDTECNEN